MISMPIDDIPQLKPTTTTPEKVVQPETQPAQEGGSDKVDIPKLNIKNKGNKNLKNHSRKYLKVEKPRHF